MTDGSPSSIQKQGLDPASEEVDDAINLFLDGMPKDPLSGPEPSPDEQFPGAPDGHSVHAQTPSGFPRSPSASNDSSSDTRTPSDAPEALRSSNNEPCGIPTPPTVFTEPEAQHESKAGLGNACDAVTTGPIILPSDDEDDMADAIELATDESCPGIRIGEAVETRLNRVIEQLLPFAEGLGISRETVDRFRLDTKLNDDAITLTLKKNLTRESGRSGSISCDQKPSRPRHLFPPCCRHFTICAIDSVPQTGI